MSESLFKKKKYCGIKFQPLKSAFTLAEVLITLGIIGVVAAMSIPALNNAIQDAKYKTAYKKAFSDAANVWQSMGANNEIETCSAATLSDSTCPYIIFDPFKTYMKISVDCGTGVVTNCWATSGESLNEILKTGSGEVMPWKSGAGARGFIDISGRSWLMARGGWYGRIVLIVDTNGLTTPNQFGKDRFVFYPLNQDNSVGAGTSVKLTPSPDRTSISIDCGYPNCYGKSWLSN